MFLKKFVRGKDGGTGLFLVENIEFFQGFLRGRALFLLNYELFNYIYDEN